MRSRPEIVRAVLAALLVAFAAGCRSPDDPLRPHYLVDFGGAPEGSSDFQTTGHLVVFNPGTVEALLDLVLYFEDREPMVLQRRAAPGSSTETNSLGWGVQQGKRFALEVRSNVAVICQATVGWTNTGGDYSPSARTSSPRGIRESVPGVAEYHRGAVAPVQG